MLSKVLSYALVGINGAKVDVETDIAAGLVRTDIVGMGDTAVKEAKDRINSAIANSGFTYPHAKVVVSLAPADMKKEGAGFDLAMAVCILAATGKIKEENIKDFVIIGELALNGEVRGISGLLPLLISARADGMRKFIVPKANMSEAAYAEDCEIYCVESLRETVEFLRCERIVDKITMRSYNVDNAGKFTCDFKYVKGQLAAKRAIEIAVSGGHNIMMVGPPGSGKTMLAKCIPTIMPPLTYEEALEVTKIHSVSGILDRHEGVVTARPFRSPHHTATTVALTGGGNKSKPGEISLAHNGVLFLDEMPEYSRHTLETLRQPLEDGVVTIARANSTVTYPARFMLVASMNPCPCGNYGSPTAACNCTKNDIDKYMGKLSAPLIDRIDLHMHVDSVTYDEINSSELSECSKDIRARVIAAREIQQKRFAGSGITCNAAMGQREFAKYCNVDEQSKSVLKQAFDRFNLSARAYTRIIKVARTIADMAGRDNIERTDIAEAIGYRTLDRNRK